MASTNPTYNNHTGATGTATGTATNAGVGAAGNTTTTTGTGPTAGTKIREGASGVKGVLAAVHGAGEALRGNFNAAVDRTFDEPTGAARNTAIANSGEGEIATGQFSTQTKNREGVVPGDKEKRSNQIL